MAQKKNTPLYLAALLLFLGGLGFLVYSGLAENSTYFLNVSEALAAPDKARSARLFGTVAAQGLQPAAGGAGVAFLLEDQTDKSLSVRVTYRGAVPDTFKAGAEVIVEGGLGADGSFAAKTLMTKCPSKYEKQNRT